MQPKGEMQSEDGTRAMHCPVYRKAVTNAIYLVTESPFSITWRGGREVEVTTPEWWQRSMDHARGAWATRAVARGITENPTAFRFHHSRPLACPKAGISNLSGHCLVNFFTGLSIETAPGTGVLVLPPVNHNHSPNHTIQTGVYDSSEFAGDFSFNMLLLRQDVKIEFQAGQPVASLFMFGELSSPPNVVQSTMEDCMRRRERADAHYFAKTQDGASYSTAVKASKCPFG
jgi:hypothetical protein